MKRILFVDDEQNILDGMRRMLRGQRQEWQMVFVDSGQKALEALAGAPFDVIVSDMRMPGMDGATLLRRVGEEHPSVVRIVLSGHADFDALLRVAAVAHQFISKPCDSEAIRNVVRRAFAFRDLLEDNRLQEAVGAIHALPTLPLVFSQLTLALADPEVSLDDVAAIVEQDQGITVKVLQLVNSSFFGAKQKIDSVHQATSRIGLSTLKSLVLSIEVFQSFDRSLAPASFSIEAEQAHATLCGRIARTLLTEKSASEQAMLAAMVHDIGKLVIATSLPDEYERLCVLGSEGEPPAVSNHAAFGAYLLGIWGLPNTIVEAVAHHHAPRSVSSQGFGVLGAVHVANALAHEVSDAAGSRRDSSAIDLEYLESVGVLDQLPAWRELAACEAELGDAA